LLTHRFTNSTGHRPSEFHLHSSGMIERCAAILTFALILATFVGCGRPDAVKEKQAMAATSRAIPVTVASAALQDMPVYLTGLGSVTAFNTVNVRSRVDGQLIQVNVREGQEVTKGELLAQIDPRPFQVQLQQAQAQQYRDQAQLRDAQLNYQRFNDLLHESGAMSQQQVDTQKAQADQLEGAVRADQAAINNAQLQITYSRITSPINGRIGLRLVDTGNIVHAADQNGLFVITQLHPIAVVFTLPEDSLPSVAQRMKHGELEVDAYARDNQNKLASGKLQTIDNQIDQQTGTGKLKAVFANTDGVLWPNQFVNVRLLLTTRKGSVVVPSAAVQRGPQGTFVYLVKQDKTVEVRPVDVALAQGNQSAIAGGLQAGEQVVTDGQDKLQQGMTVVPQSRSDAHASQPPTTVPTT
jgi:membrane fusion protein, multidrug efflux system